MIIEKGERSRGTTMARANKEEAGRGGDNEGQTRRNSGRRKTIWGSGCDRAIAGEGGGRGKRGEVAVGGRRRKRRQEVAVGGRGRKKRHVTMAGGSWVSNGLHPRGGGEDEG